MIELISIAVISLVIGAVIFWYLRFRFMLPLERSLEKQVSGQSKFVRFSKETAEVTRIADSKDALADLFQQAVTRLHKFFPRSGIWLFESNGAGAWKLVSQAASAWR